MQQHQNGNDKTGDVEAQIKKRQCGQAKKEELQEQTDPSGGGHHCFSRPAGIAFYGKHTPKRGKKNRQANGRQNVPQLRKAVPAPNGKNNQRPHFEEKPQNQI